MHPRPTVLVVDGSPVERTALAGVLRDAGFEVRQAAAGEECLDQAGRDGLQVVVLGVHLPDLDGFEVCRRLKADPATATLPVILVAGPRAESRERVLGL